MAEPALAPLEVRHPLGGFHADIGSSVLDVVMDKTLLTIDYPAWSKSKLTTALGPLSDPGRSAGYGEEGHLLWTGVGQLMSFSETGAVTEASLSETIGPSGYVTDITDGWIALAWDGPDAQARLDLITMPDLAEESFAIGAVTSTLLNHIRVLIWRQTETRLILLSMASSAGSLVHGLADALERAPS